MPKIPTFIVSIPASEAQYRSVAAQLNESLFAVHKPVGFSGRTLPDSVCFKLTRDRN
jgi:hypothetical protein